MKNGIRTIHKEIVFRLNEPRFYHANNWKYQIQHDNESRLPKVNNIYDGEP